MDSRITPSQALTAREAASGTISQCLLDLRIIATRSRPTTPPARYPGTFLPSRCFAPGTGDYRFGRVSDALGHGAGKE